MNIKQENQHQRKNPLLTPYNTPFETIPFDQIELSHYMEAFHIAMEKHNEEIEAIINNPKPPTYENTIEKLERSGKLLNKVASPFYNLLSAETSDKLEKIAEELSPLLTNHNNSITLNPQLFARIKSVYQQKEELALPTDSQILLQDTYDSFAHNGGNLNEKEKEKYRQLTEKLNLSTLKFGQNVLKATNDYLLHITDPTELDGLPNDTMDILVENAKKVDKEDWVINLKITTLLPVMKFANNRALRKKLYLANATRAMQNDNNDNTQILIDIANLRLEIARLLGYKNYADQVLQHRMAKNSETILNLLSQLLQAYSPKAKEEVEELQHFANKQGVDFTIQAWDWAYYAEKLRAEKFQINDELLKPYLELEKIKKGGFWLANKLYGLTFVENNEIPTYHPEVRTYEVMDKNGDFLAIFYADYHPRDEKRGGAWMNDLKGQWIENQIDSRPHIINVMNFTPPTADKPALLTFDEVTTLLHEFGHALHGILSKCRYESQSGTNVYRDFVELPSQIMENWAVEKEFLDKFATHYQTGEKMPKELIRKIKDAENFNVGYATLRQLTFGYLDMAWHTITTPYNGNFECFEKEAIKHIELLPVISKTGISQTFGHIFAGGYAAGYYSYKWAEVLDADAYALFQKNGIFDRETATSFRKNILERGGSEDPMTLYKRFRGDTPSIDALLHRNGVKKNTPQ